LKEKHFKRFKKINTLQTETFKLFMLV